MQKYSIGANIKALYPCDWLRFVSSACPLAKLARQAGMKKALGERLEDIETCLRATTGRKVTVNRERFIGDFSSLDTPAYESLKYLRQAKA